MDFPLITNPDYPLEGSPENNSIYSKFENGAVQARRKFTKSRDTLTLTWKGLPTEEFLKLDDWVKNKACFAANDFYWTHPVTKEKKLYHIATEDSPYTYSYTNFNQWSVTLKITEV